MGSVVASGQAGSYRHTLSNDRSSRQMGLPSTCLSEPQTRGLPVNVTCKKVMVWGDRISKRVLFVVLRMFRCEDNKRPNFHIVILCG